MKIAVEIDGESYHTTMLDFAQANPAMMPREADAVEQLLRLGYPAFVGGGGFPRATLHPIRQR